MSKLRQWQVNAIVSEIMPVIKARIEEKKQEESYKVAYEEEIDNVSAEFNEDEFIGLVERRDELENEIENLKERINEIIRYVGSKGHSLGSYRPRKNELGKAVKDEAEKRAMSRLGISSPTREQISNKVVMKD